MHQQESCTLAGAGMTRFVLTSDRHNIRNGWLPWKPMVIFYHFMIHFPEIPKLQPDVDASVSDRLYRTFNIVTVTVIQPNVSVVLGECLSTRS